ncbi:hypothetical protein [Nodularia sphaerocarpa]|uniref:hypothetical protein n=1 Tax=Nodularia sphaerocarpa TaxID=137816 RepID=UPI001EFA2F29|nr:hypothetical protein [Nodularia sphaerocarpa]MDB9372902.1 hypothetical protein [Nodularia sphaerocarpa CS-585]MDB9376290.1 hypothetical protein [Nodularia sphaerocarpa CS-585A2]ULP71639.1 hypothetical protein BDGGKGIB_01270 [Nodularia sphaerocarpa UHCC 0038]
MINKINGLDTFNALPSAVELELLETILEPEDATYPWNPADDESEAYFSELEQQFAMQDWLDEELTAKSPTFYAKLDSLWSQVSINSNDKCQSSLSVVDSLQVTLNSAFAHSVPPGWLNAIASKAAEIFATQQSMSEQLVQCVQSVLPAWDVDDLFVLARPFAHPMRSRKSLQETKIISKVKNRDWLTLSEIEQAKISVAIAYYAFRQLNNFQSED